jgi:hypothetical protein
MVPNLLAVSNLYSFFHQLLIRFANSIVSRIQKFNFAVIQSQMATNYVTAATATVSYGRESKLENYRLRA